MDRATLASYGGVGAVARGKAWAQWRGEAGAQRHGREVAGVGSRWRGEARARRRAAGEQRRRKRGGTG